MYWLQQSTALKNMKITVPPSTARNSFLVSMV